VKVYTDWRLCILFHVVCVCIEMSAASVFNSVLVSHLILDINLLCIVPSTYLVLITSCVSGYVTETNFRGNS